MLCSKYGKAIYLSQRYSSTNLRPEPEDSDAALSLMPDSYVDWIKIAQSF